MILLREFVIRCVKYFNSTGNFCKHRPASSQLRAETGKLFSVVWQCQLDKLAEKRREKHFYVVYMKIYDLWEEGKKVSAKPQEEKTRNFHLLQETVAGQLRMTRWWDQMVPEAPYGR